MVNSGVPAPVYLTCHLGTKAGPLCSSTSTSPPILGTAEGVSFWQGEGSPKATHNLLRESPLAVSLSPRGAPRCRHPHLPCTAPRGVVYRAPQARQGTLQDPELFTTPIPAEGALEGSLCLRPWQGEGVTPSSLLPGFKCEERKGVPNLSPLSSPLGLFSHPLGRVSP